MPENNTITQTMLAVKEQFGIDEPVAKDLQNDEESYRILLLLLTQKLTTLIDTDFQQFLNILYRIDVDENKVKSILSQEPLDIAVEMIAELIINRQKQKIITRQQYSNPNNDLSFDI